MIPTAGIALNGSNLIGYIWCRRDASAKLSAVAGKFIGRQIVKQVSVCVCVCVGGGGGGGG